MWIEILRTLELDKKAQSDLFLLAQQGIAGRSEANEILWGLLSDHALRAPYRDFSNKCSNRVGQARQYLDRPGWVIRPGMEEILGPRAATTTLETLTSVLVLSLIATSSSLAREDFH